MKFSIRFADKIVGTLVIIALAMLIFVIFMLGKNQRWFVHDPRYITYFSSASGVSMNMAIQYKGFTIGYVKEISLTEDDNVKVIFTVFEEYAHRVREGSLVELQASPIGLGNSFIFYPGNGNTLPEGFVIPEINSPEGKLLLASGMAERMETSDNINSIITHVNTLLATINSSLGAKDDEGKTALNRITADLGDTIARLRVTMGSISEQVDPILGNVEALLDSDGRVVSSLTDTLSSISGIMKSVDDTIKVVPDNLPQITILLSNLHSTLIQAERLIVSLTNNPLLRNGVPEVRETGPGGASPRNMEF